jgi:hypothetical protein
MVHESAISLEGPIIVATSTVKVVVSDGSIQFHARLAKLCLKE